MNGFFGQGDQLVRFLLLTCGLLTLAGAVACLVLVNPFLAVACCIVSAWALGTYLDTVYLGLMQSNREKLDKSTTQTDE